MSSTTISAKSSTKTIAINGISIALVFLATAFINIKLPIVSNGGLIHLGNVPLFLAAIIFGKKTGAIAGSFGMALSDLLSGWVMWAPFTFIITGIIGYCVGKVTEKESHNTLLWYLFAIILALIIKVIGYYFAEVIMYQNFIAPISSIPGNVVQILTAGVITLILVKPLKKQLDNIMRS